MPSHRKSSESDELPPNIGAPATRALTAAGITRITQLARFSEADLLNLHGVGPKALRLLRRALTQRGLKFAPAKDSRTAVKRPRKR